MMFSTQNWALTLTAGGLGAAIQGFTANFVYCRIPTIQKGPQSHYFSHGNQRRGEHKKMRASPSLLNCQIEGRRPTGDLISRDQLKLKGSDTFDQKQNPLARAKYSVTAIENANEIAAEVDDEFPALEVFFDDRPNSVARS